MATKQRSLGNARLAKQDEFYTQLSDIEKELKHYRKHFRGKVVYLNCDDPRESNFFHFFSFNFEKLGLKKLIAACYKSVDWGSLHRRYNSAPLEAIELEERVNVLMSDTDVRRKVGIYEFVLGGEGDPRLIEVRVFDEKTELAAYGKQTELAEASGTSNCPMCAVGSNNNAERIYEFTEMEADHVTAWSKGGATDISNCEMLCIPHNRSKGNR